MKIEYAHREKIMYSRDEAVSAITSYYEWLVELYLPSSALKHPLTGGWHKISPEYLAFVKKSDTVMAANSQHGDPCQIYEKISAVDYNGNYLRSIGVNYREPTAADPLEVETIIPSHVEMIAHTGSDRDGHYFFLVTERGTMTRCDF